MTDSSQCIPQLNHSWKVKAAALFWCNSLAVLGLTPVFLLFAFASLYPLRLFLCSVAICLIQLLWSKLDEAVDHSPKNAQKDATCASFHLWFPLFRALRDYHQVELDIHKRFQEAEAKDNAKFVVALHPHGAVGSLLLMLKGAMYDVLPQTGRKFRTLAASFLFHLPLVRQILIQSGCVDASPYSATQTLQDGNSLLVLPGGTNEQMLCQRGRERLYLSKRKGFLKLATKSNIPVVPVYVFGVSDMYHTSSSMWARFQQRFHRHTKIALPFIGGLCGTVCPLPVKLTLVTGPPLDLHELMRNPELGPTTEELDAMHDTYCHALQQLFDEHKARLGYGDRELEIL